MKKLAAVVLVTCILLLPVLASSSTNEENVVQQKRYSHSENVSEKYTVNKIRDTFEKTVNIQQYYQHNPRIWGYTVMWLDYLPPSTYDFYVLDLITGIITVTGINPTLAYADYDIWGNEIVWSNDDGIPGGTISDIWGYNYNNQPSKFPICIYNEEQYDPHNWGRYVVWEDWRGANPGGSGVDIYGYDHITQNIIPICTNPENQMRPDIWFRSVVWEDNRNGNYDIYLKNLWTGNEKPICTNPSQQRRPAIWGKNIIWLDDRNGNHWDIYGYDLLAQQEFKVLKPSSQTGIHLELWGNNIIWNDYRNQNWDLYGYNIITQTEFPVCTHPADQEDFDIWGDIVVWEDTRGGNLDIYGYNISPQTEFPICIT